MASQLFERLNKKLKVHIKLDTGMNRIGINKNDAKDFIQKVLNCPSIELKGIFTHFADVENEALFNRQIKEFEEIIEPYKNKNIKIHCQNIQK